MGDELLPCPFCGREPRRMDRPSVNTATGHFWVISCSCGGYSARAHMPADTEAEAIRLWNTRTADAELAALRASLAAAEARASRAEKRLAAAVTFIRHKADHYSDAAPEDNPFGGVMFHGISLAFREAAQEIEHFSVRAAAGIGGDGSDAR